MLLAIDIGNTNIVLGLYKDEQLCSHWRLSARIGRTADEWGMLLLNLFSHDHLDYHDVKAIAVSSVVPPVMPIIEEMARQYFQIEPLVVGPGVKTGMPILYDNPREVGADRIVNAVAGYELYGGPLLIVDFGTATTFCVVNEKGEYLGGAITAGIDSAMEALFQRTAKLPRVELVKPSKVIGRNTVSSMQSGLYYGFIGQIEGIIGKISEEIGLEPFVVVTGGISRFIARESAMIDKEDPFLTLEGLRIIYNRNC